MSPLVDQFSRTISYLRLSITDRCNLRCLYCMPEENEADTSLVKSGRFLNHSELLSYEELLRVVRLAISLGMNKIRLTGGEPLIRRGVLDFIHELYQLEGLQEVRLTTNGVLLAQYAERLWKEGVRQLNVSLDSMQKDKFQRITGRDHFNDVWKGLSVAEELGFRIKLNIVAMRGTNDDEFVDFARLALTRHMQIRFIEFMPVGEKSRWERDSFIKANEIQKIVSELGEMTPSQRHFNDGPARMFTLTDKNGNQGSVGFISPISHHFCDQCNRLRLTSEGRLRACLLNDTESDLKTLIRKGATDEDIMATIRETILNKPMGHKVQNRDEQDSQGPACSGRMSRIGG